MKSQGSDRMGKDGQTSTNVMDSLPRLDDFRIAKVVEPSGVCAQLCFADSGAIAIRDIAELLRPFARDEPAVQVLLDWIHSQTNDRYDNLRFTLRQPDETGYVEEFRIWAEKEFEKTLLDPIREAFNGDFSFFEQMEQDDDHPWQEKISEQEDGEIKWLIEDHLNPETSMIFHYEVETRLLKCDECFIVKAGYKPPNGVVVLNA